MATTEKSDTMPNATEKRDKPPFPRPKAKTSKIPPGPKKKSTTETPLTNDPLWKNSFVIDGETGFTSEDAAREFEADAAGYVNLIEEEYKAISEVDRYYGKAVSASAHAYYHNVLYWYKVALIAQKRGVASIDQERLIRFVDGYGSAVIAAGAGEYLEGLGDYTDSAGVKHLFHAREPNEHGHFGRVAAHTHGLYETLPAPAIFLERAIEDLIGNRRGEQPNANWVPRDIAPDMRRAAPAPAPAVDAECEQRVLRRAREEEYCIK